MRMPTEVIALEPFVSWYNDLDDAGADDVEVGVELLAARGVGLGHPWSSAIKGSRLALRELRIQSKGRPFRIFYLFDAARQAVLLIGGDKTGDKRFYSTHIAAAERVYEEYIDEESR